MPTRLERTYRFEAAHFLPRVPEGHKCARMHGHSYAIDVIVQGEVDPELGWLIDFGDLDALVMPLVDQLDHRVLNEIEGLANPTSEVLSRWFYTRLKAKLPTLVEVVSCETPGARCAYGE
jgi:6-pyruvoyltetrahydropterin/6-carboxytetrahydropterin synthase